jgi:hypothetical protein
MMLPAINYRYKSEEERQGGGSFALKRRTGRAGFAGPDCTTDIKTAKSGLAAHFCRIRT